MDGKGSWTGLKEDNEEEKGVRRKGRRKVGLLERRGRGVGSHHGGGGLMDGLGGGGLMDGLGGG